MTRDQVSRALHPVRTVFQRPEVLAGWALIIGLSVWTTVTGGAEVLLLLLPAAVVATSVLVVRTGRVQRRRLDWDEIERLAVYARPRRTNVGDGSRVIAVRASGKPRLVVWVVPVEDGDWAVFTAVGHGAGQEETMKASELDQRERDWNLRYIRDPELSEQLWDRFFSG
jgi:hypothetical protein